ncbi:MAG: archaeosortase A, partial [Halapricum sp.]
MTLAFTDGLAWVVVGLFTAATALDWYDGDRGRGRARYVAAAAWVVFGGFWLALFPHFAFVQHSFIEGVLSLAGLPASLYVAYLLAQGRESLFLLSRAVAFMGLIYLPFTMLAPASEWLIETVAAQGAFVMRTFGFHPQVVDRAGDLHGTYQLHTAHGRFTVNV